MWRNAGYVVGLAVNALVMSQQTVAGPERDVAVVEVVERTTGDRFEKGDVIYPLAVLDGAGWEWAHLERAIQEVEAIFAQCGVVVTAGTVYRLEVPDDFRELDESEQARLLAALPTSRPVVLLVDRTTDHDVAYSYLKSAPVASRGTAWVTRNSEPACLAALLAHELGHILLNTARHSDDPDNLMSHTCTSFNVAEWRIGTGLSAAQCKQLREP